MTNAPVKMHVVVEEDGGGAMRHLLPGMVHEPAGNTPSSVFHSGGDKPQQTPAPVCSMQCGASKPDRVVTERPGRGHRHHVLLGAKNVRYNSVRLSRK